jgi:hypothetical protein
VPYCRKIAKINIHQALSEGTMANCDNLFKEFNNTIKLSESKKDSLRTSRDSLRKKAKEKFREKGGYDLKFHWQGSLAMNTIIMPKDEDYDIDDGAYIQGEDVPKESVETLHNWLVEAAEEHTALQPKDKPTCVRVFFKEKYHVDLVLYHKKLNAHPQLAHKSKGWTDSDPKEFMEWFNARSDDNGQLKRVVRYFKTWADELRGEMPGGLIFTILATNNIRFNDRDDVSFLETMETIYSTLNNLFVCYRPTTPTNEDLFANYSETRRKYLLERLNSFIQSGKQTLEMPNQKDACPKWQKHFGERFPCNLAEDKLENSKSFDAPAFIKSDARSAYHK